MSALSDAASIGGPVARGLLYIKSEKKENEGRRVLSNFYTWVYWEQQRRKRSRFGTLNRDRIRAIAPIHGPQRERR
jgi:hypothetical protein